MLFNHRHERERTRRVRREPPCPSDQNLRPFLTAARLRSSSLSISARRASIGCHSSLQMACLCLRRTGRLSKPSPAPRPNAVTYPPKQPCERLDQVKPGDQYSESQASQRRLGVKRLLCSCHSGLDKRRCHCQHKNRRHQQQRWPSQAERGQNLRARPQESTIPASKAGRQECPRAGS